MRLPRWARLPVRLWFMVFRRPGEGLKPKVNKWGQSEYYLIPPSPFLVKTIVFIYLQNTGEKDVSPYRNTLWLRDVVQCG